MGRRSRRKRSKNQRRKDDRYPHGAAAVDTTVRAGAPRQRDVRVRIELLELEVAKGHDGLLRGMPEPVAIAAAWLVGPSGPLLVGRRTVRFETPVKLPTTLQVPERIRLDARLPGSAGSVLLVLVCAVEEDTGHGVQEVFAAMERSADLAILWSEGEHPHGGPLDEFARTASSGLRLPRPVHVELDHKDLGERVEGDDWIAAAACVAGCHETGRRSLRFPFRSADDRNDWTLRANVDVKL